MKKTHTFHIPVMGIAFTIDTPLKVSQFGIDSVISLVDDILLERLRKVYCGKYDLPYSEISEKTEDYRAKRITSYLNLMNELAEKKFEELKNAAIGTGNDIKAYLEMLPARSELKKEFDSFTDKYLNISDFFARVKENLHMGSIDVNIMTKLDKENYLKGEQLPVEFNDAHAALRGFAKSDLRSSIVLSAGMNPRLYSYLEKFDDFYPDENGEIKKKIALKVSDFRSALIQGKFLAKKGLWVSEFRIESGLNCGGHAFASDGYLMGPILEEFRTKRNELNEVIYNIFADALKAKKRPLPKEEPKFKISAQGGVGTSEEHEFLLDYYEVDSVGWGSPFLLVPEVTTVDPDTMMKLIEAKEKDLYLSNISPLGVPFNSLRGNSKEIESRALIEKGRPGSSCPKKFLEIHNKEFTDKNICTASRQYQHLKLKELDEKNLSVEEHKSRFEKIVEKACLCTGLGTAALLNNSLSTKKDGDGVSVCPGPNMAYFSKISTLKEMTDHIYGRANVIARSDRPNMFLKELSLYLDYLKTKIDETQAAMNDKQEKYLLNFVTNLNEGISYYFDLFTEAKHNFEDKKAEILAELEVRKEALRQLHDEIKSLSSVLAPAV